MSIDLPVGSVSSWLAVRDRTQVDVAEALGVTGGRSLDPGEALVEEAATLVLASLRGEGGRWTLALGADVAEVSTTRLTSIGALLSTQVQLFGTVPGRWLCADRGRLVEEQDLPDVGAVLSIAGARSLDPTALTEAVVGSAVLFERVVEGPPPPEPLPRPRKRWWQWSPPGAR